MVRFPNRTNRLGHLAFVKKTQQKDRKLNNPTTIEIYLRKKARCDMLFKIITSLTETHVKVMK